MPAPMTHRGFTLIELLASLVAIGVLIGLSIPLYRVMTTKARITATRGVIAAWTAAVLADPQSTVTAVDGSIRRRWDIDGDGRLDGDPQAVGAPASLRDAAPASYRGAVQTAQLDLPAWASDALAQPIDRWRHPLRIAFARRCYGGRDVGIWSPGPDGIDGTADDIRSWERN